MGKRYLIDTNCIIDAQMNAIPRKGMLFLEQILNDEFIISFVSYIEFLGYKNISKDSETFISFANVLEINKEIIDSCINIRRRHSIKLPDAIIAATALVYNLIIVSRNTKDFLNIEGLTTINPYDL